MEDQEVLNNAETPADKPDATASAPAPEGQVNTATETKTEESFFDPKGLPPELEQAYKQMQASYTKKTQELAESRKKAESLDQLVKYKPFVDWYNRHTSGTDKSLESEQPKSQDSASKEPAVLFEELSDEEYQFLMADKKKMGQYLFQKMQEQASQVALPIAQAAQKKVEYLENLNRIERFSQENPNFWELDNRGLIDPLIDKYPGMDIEDVYKLANYKFLEQQAIQKAHQIIQAKKNATVEKPGLGVQSSGKVKVKSREEAMALAWEFASRGQAPPDFEISK